MSTDLRPRRRRDGVDLTLRDAPSEAVLAEVLCSCLLTKGFCVVDAGLEEALLQRALREVNELKAAGRLYQPPDMVAEGLLGVEGSAHICELHAPPEDAGPDKGTALQQLDVLMWSLGALVNDWAEGLGFASTHRTACVVHESGVPQDGPPLREKDVTNWLEKFLRHKTMTVIFLGPMDGALRLKVHEDEESEEHEVPTMPGRVVVLRPDIMSHQHIALGKAVALSCFGILGQAFQKRHPTGGWIMCPAAKALDRWAMQRIKELKARFDDASDWDPEIPREWQRAMNLWVFKGHMPAVRGLACKMPSTWQPDAFMASLFEGPDLVTTIPLERWDHDRYYDPSPECWKYGKSFVQHGAFMEGIELFDPKVFNISVMEARGMDPNQRLVLEVGYDAFYRMGLRRNALMNAAGSVYVGHSFGDWGFVEKHSEGGIGGPTGGAGCIVANRLSFCLGMKGPSMTLDTDGSSSLTAVYMAGESLQKKGRGAVADIAVGMGSATMLTPIWWPQHCAQGWLSFHGRCFTFDAAASGYVRGETCAGAAMKSVSDDVDGKAMLDEKYLVGVIAGSCLNTNGRCASLSAPNGAAEQEVIADAVRNAGIAAADVDAVEAHGSGTYLGDVIEVSSLMRGHRFQELTQPLAITSVKTAYGNTIESAGIVSLFKVLLGAQWALISSTNHLREVNPHMDIVDAPVMLVSESLEYARKNSFSGVMSQGFGGTNVYCVTWGQLDEEKVKPSPSFPAHREHIHFWPGGGGQLASEQLPNLGYYIVGSWGQWTDPEYMEEEDDGVYGYTVTLGDGAWEQFYILLDADPKRALHPDRPEAPRESPVLGPDEDTEGCFWLVDGRPTRLTLPADAAAELPQGGAAAEVEEAGEGGSRMVTVLTQDTGRPGDKYRVRLHVAGRWRHVDWEKLEEVAEGPDPTGLPHGTWPSSHSGP